MINKGLQKVVKQPTKSYLYYLVVTTLTKSFQMRSRRRDVPSTVGMEGMDEVLTPRSRNQQNKFNFDDSAIQGVRSEKKADHSREVDAYKNPTELFKCINVGDSDGAIQRCLDHPAEAKTWIVSKGQPSTTEEDQQHSDAPIKWRYLPLHLVCLKANPVQQLVRALVFAYPKGAKQRDKNGNLPIHYVVAEGCDDSDIIEILFEAYPNCAEKKNGNGLTLPEILSMSYKSGKISKATMMKMRPVLNKIQIEGGGRSHSVRDERQGAQSRGREGQFEVRDKPDSFSVASFRVQTPERTGSWSFHGSESKANSVKSTRKSNRHEKKLSREDFFAGDMKMLNASLQIPSLNHPSIKAVKSTKKSKHHEKKPSWEAFFDDDLKPSNNLSQKEENGSNPPNHMAEKKRGARHESFDHPLDDYMDERDVLREKVSELKNQNVEQNNTIKQLTTKLTTVSTELNGEKSKMEKKLAHLDEMQAMLEERSNKMNEMIAKFEVKEKDSIQISPADSEQSVHVSFHEEQTFSTKDISDQKDYTDLKLRVLDLEKELREERSKRQPTSTGEIEKIQAEGQLRESRLQATVASLERELLVALGAKKNSSSVNDVTREAFKAKIAALERELHESNKKRAGGAHDLEKVKTDAFIVENQLRGKIADLERQLSENSEEPTTTPNTAEFEQLQEKNKALEKQLLESNDKISDLSNELDNVKAASVAKGKEIEEILSKQSIDGVKDVKLHVKDLEEENKAIKLMNSSLQDHIKTLKDKCNKLEQSLVDTKNENNDLVEQYKSAAEKMNIDSDVKERHSELQAEFQKLWMHVQNMPKERETQISKITAEDYEQRVQALRDIITNNHSAHEQAVDALVHKQNSLKSENKALKKEIDRLRDETKQLSSNTKVMESTSKELSELTQRANAYKGKLSKLQDEIESHKANNASLRDIIMKNNNTFTAKVEALRKERDELKRAGSDAASAASSNQTSTKQLSDRLNSVASYLISISELQKRIAKSTEVGESRQDDAGSVAQSDSAQFTGVDAYEQAMLNTTTMNDRIDILQGVDAKRKSEDEIMRIIRSESERDLIGESLQAQNRVLDEIQAEIGDRQR